jgi:hypothetical protein
MILREETKMVKEFVAKKIYAFEGSKHRYYIIDCAKCEGYTAMYVNVYHKKINKFIIQGASASVLDRDLYKWTEIFTLPTETSIKEEPEVLDDNFDCQ